MKEETKVSYDKEAYIKKKREQLDNAYKTIDEGLEEITTNPDFFKEYLTVQGKFDLYTPRNAILIAKQLPNAIQLKEMKKWIEDNISFKSKYPKKIVILDPREPYTTKDGRTIKGYTAKELVDISETNMKPYTKTYDKNILRIIDLSNKSVEQIKEVITTEKIRDAVAFQDSTSDKNNHFVKLIINGEKRQLNGLGSGANPRTAIGQRKDGSILLLVTDGRGKNGHLGATASDLIDIMSKYEAINAANLDGGSSSSMYYKDKYLMTSVTFYYANSSWKLPTAFVVKE